MQHERFRELLDAYGSRESAWPSGERTAMQRLLEEDAQARQLVTEARELDLLLDSYQPELPDLSARVLAAVPQSTLESTLESTLNRLVRWLLPREPGGWWHPALASALPLLLGLAIGISQPDPMQLAEQQDDWELQERYLLAPPAGIGNSEGSWYE